MVYEKIFTSLHPLPDSRQHVPRSLSTCWEEEFNTLIPAFSDNSRYSGNSDYSEYSDYSKIPEDHQEDALTCSSIRTDPIL